MEEGGLIGIGAAAQRFGLVPSTLRYWEERGLLVPASRNGKWRYYGAEELHRIALIQLWQDTGLMSLEEIAVVLTGTTRDRNWQDAVRDRVKQIERQQAQLKEARTYLRHLLKCPDENPTQHCPYLRRATKKIVDSKSSSAKTRQAPAMPGSRRRNLRHATS